MDTVNVESNVTTLRYVAKVTYNFDAAYLCVNSNRVTLIYTVSYIRAIGVNKNLINISLYSVGVRFYYY